MIADQYAGLLDPLLTDHCPSCHARRVPFKHLARGHVDPFCSTACCKAWYAVDNATEQLADFDRHDGPARYFEGENRRRARRPGVTG